MNKDLQNNTGGENIKLPPELQITVEDLGMPDTLLAKLKHAPISRLTRLFQLLVFLAMAGGASATSCSDDKDELYGQEDAAVNEDQIADVMVDGEPPQDAQDDDTFYIPDEQGDVGTADDDGVTVDDGVGVDDGIAVEVDNGTADDGATLDNGITPDDGKKDAIDICETPNKVMVAIKIEGGGTEGNTFVYQNSDESAPSKVIGCKEVGTGECDFKIEMNESDAGTFMVEAFTGKVGTNIKISVTEEGSLTVFTFSPIECTAADCDDMRNLVSLISQALPSGNIQGVVENAAKWIPSIGAYKTMTEVGGKGVFESGKLGTPTTFVAVSGMKKCK